VPYAQLANRRTGRRRAEEIVDLHDQVLDDLALLGARHGIPWYRLPGSPMQDVTTFEEFWPHYVHAHRNPVNRGLHYVGTTAVIGTVAAAAVTLNPAWLLLAPVVGYGPAWVGHFVFERNKPATFQHPLWSLRGDFRMYGLALRGRMHQELERICGGNLGPDHTHEDHLERQAAAARTNGTAAATA
jgi:hypothetical protein